MTETWKYIKYPVSTGLLIVLLTGCFQSEYTRMVQQEMATGTRNDSLLLGIEFGDGKPEFISQYWELNRTGMVREGLGDGSVRYTLKDSLFHKQPTEIRLLFRPGYDDKNLISEMHFEFSYVAWAPWNKDLQSDSLMTKTLRFLKNGYGGN